MTFGILLAFSLSTQLTKLLHFLHDTPRTELILTGLKLTQYRTLRSTPLDQLLTMKQTAFEIFILVNFAVFIHVHTDFYYLVQN